MKWNLDTELIHGRKKDDENQEVKVITSGITPAVAYAFPNVEMAAGTVRGEIPGTFYGRYGNPTTAALEEKIAHLENGEAALGVSSGMAAISIALLAYVQQGDHVLVTKDVYGGTYKFLSNFGPRFGFSFDFVDCTNYEAVEAAIQPNTKVLYIETPSNPCLTVLDIKKLSDLAHAYHLTVIVDNTFMTPYLQKPLELGADVVVHSATKYLNGHGDLLAGFIVGKAETISLMHKEIMGDLGQILNAWESFLIMRGLKTLGLRMRQHCQTAQIVAEFLETHPSVAKVYYPGLKSHPQYDLAQQQMKMMGGIVSFELNGSLDEVNRFLNALQLALISFSLGDPETLIQHPASMTHFSIPPEERERFHITDGLIRLSLGLEDAEDIIADLDQALSVIDQGVTLK